LLGGIIINAVSKRAGEIELKGDTRLGGRTKGQTGGHDATLECDAHEMRNPILLLKVHGLNPVLTGQARQVAAAIRCEYENELATMQLMRQGLHQ
jgi:hypothetical protein